MAGSAVPDFDLNIVLVEPEIPQNTGSIGRLCLATGSRLHLVEPLGFEMSEKQLRRAGLDYWDSVKMVIHPSLEAFLKSVPEDAPISYFSKKAGREIYEHRFKRGAYLVFGKETAGLPDWLLNRNAMNLVRIPLFDARVRSLNLSQAVGIASYEAIRQMR